MAQDASCNTHHHNTRLAKALSNSCVLIMSTATKVASQITAKSNIFDGCNLKKLYTVLERLTYCERCSEGVPSKSYFCCTGVTEDDYMRKVEVVHCMACNIYIPAVFASVQQHRRSPLHLKTKVVHQLKSVLQMFNTNWYQPFIFNHLK